MEHVDRTYEVHKFGGAALADNERIFKNAADIANIVSDGHTRIVVVVSAQGKTTDALLEKMRAMDPGLQLGDPAVDLMLSTGETQSVALMLAALKRSGIQDAVHMAAHQLPMELADGTNGRSAGFVQGINGQKFLDTFGNHRVIVTPGFVGIDKAGGTRTMGRGGSDLSAVAFAYAIQKILGIKIPAIFEKEVAAVLAANPNIVKNAKRLPFASYHDCRRLLAASDDQFIAPRAAKAAESLGVRMVFQQAACFLPPGQEQKFPGTIIDVRREDDPSIEADSDLRALAIRAFTLYDYSDEDQGAVLDGLEQMRIAEQDTAENSQGGGHKIILPYLKERDKEEARAEKLARLPLRNRRDVGVLRIMHPALLEAQGHVNAQVRRVMAKSSYPFIVKSEEECVVVQVNVNDIEHAANALAKEFDLCESEAA